MPFMQVHKTLIIEGEPVSFSNTLGQVEFGSKRVWEIDLPAVDSQNVGELTTRTDADTGVVTLLAAHDIETADIVDVYWSGGVRYGMTATKAAAAVTVDGGAGDDLPVLNTVGIVVTEQTLDTSIDFDGDDASIIAVVYSNPIDSDAKAHIDFQDVGNATIEELDMVDSRQAAGLDEVVDISNGDSNTYTGNAITHGQLSHNSTTGAGKLYIYVGI